MAQDIQIFNNPEFGVIRTAGTSEQPLFCLSDLCHAIGIKDVSRCASRLDDDVRQTHPIQDELGRTQQATFVTESGMYDVIIRSDSPQAKPFRKWVTSEVLPTIRKTGSYSVRTESKQPAIGFKEKMQAATWAAKFLNLNESSKLLIAKQILEPYNFKLPDYTPSHGILKSASELLAARGLKISAQVFNKRAVEKGFLTELERNSSHGQKKRFKSITQAGLTYGENQVNPNNPKSTQPSWYASKFDELLKVLGFQTMEELPYGNE